MFGSWVKKINVKNAHRPKLITPSKVRIIVIEGGATSNPIIKPIVPVPKNIIIKTFTLIGAMYLILTKGIKIWHYYKLTDNSISLK